LEKQSCFSAITNTKEKKMKKVITMIAVTAVAAVATADLAFFQFKGSSLDLGAAPATYANAAVVVLGDQTLAVSGNELDIANLIPTWLSGSLTVKPAFAGGGYASTAPFAERPFMGGVDFADTLATLIYDPNGGGIQVGDLIGLYTFNIKDMAAVGVPAPALPQDVVIPNLVAGTTVTVIPEPATLGLMGIAGLGMFLARKKARR
jgi:hypothetical protein